MPEMRWRRPIIAGNWKMNGTLQAAREVEAMGDALRLAPRRGEGPAVILCPPATLLLALARAAQMSGIALGAQDAHPQPTGAHTGDLSPEMLADVGARYCLVGHSERRHSYGEDNAAVRAKAEACHRAGLVPIVCVGETAAERDAGIAETVITRMVKASWPGTQGPVILAYEPVWAIGTGQPPSQAVIAERHAALRAQLAGDIPLLYGGSVSPQNADAILRTPHVDGVLVGGSSLKASDFLAIIDAALPLCPHRETQAVSPTRTTAPDGYLDRILTIELGRCTEAAAVAASTMIGRGDKEGADQAAVTALREAFNKLDIDGTIVIGEGERDEAPMLYIGEKVGRGGPRIDIALDPLEGTDLTAKAMADALAVVAMSTGGGFLHAPDVYMDKIACGPGYPDGVIDLDASPQDNITSLARAKGVPPTDITLCVLDRERHQAIIEAARGVGARVFLIPDGDVAGIFHTTRPQETGIDLYIGQGGAPEGVLAAAALRCVGGQMQARLVFRNDDERGRARKAGITDFSRKYDLMDLASGDVMFAATGVTDGAMLRGVKWRGPEITTDTLVMRSKTGTVRRIQATSRAENFRLG